MGTHFLCPHKINLTTVGWNGNCSWTIRQITVNNSCHLDWSAFGNPSVPVSNAFFHQTQILVQGKLISLTDIQDPEILNDREYEAYVDQSVNQSNKQTDKQRHGAITLVLRQSQRKKSVLCIYHNVIVAFVFWCVNKTTLQLINELLRMKQIIMIICIVTFCRCVYTFYSIKCGFFECVSLFAHRNSFHSAVLQPAVLALLCFASSCPPFTYFLAFDVGIDLNMSSSQRIGILHQVFKLETFDPQSLNSE